MNEENKMNAEILLNELKEIKDSFKNVPQKILKEIVKTKLQDDVNDLLEFYDKEIAQMPRTDPVKLEILNIMLYLGISPFDKMTYEEK